MKPLIFDTHAHYTSPQFNKNRASLLESLPQQGVKYVLDCAVDYQSAQQSLKLAESYSWLYTAVGIHPQSIINERGSTQWQFKGDWQREMDTMRDLYSHPKVVAVGECGLDKHWPVPEKPQVEMFKAHIQTAQELGLPLVIHDREAHGLMYELLAQYKPCGVLHSYSGTAQDAEWLTKQGLYIGFTGVVTFKNAAEMREAAAAVPSDKLLLETDCPYLAPVPYRGKVSDSSMIVHTAKTIAEVRRTTTEAILHLALTNAKRLFNLQKTAG